MPDGRVSDVCLMGGVVCLMGGLLVCVITPTEYVTRGARRDRGDIKY